MRVSKIGSLTTSDVDGDEIDDDEKKKDKMKKKKSKKMPLKRLTNRNLCTEVSLPSTLQWQKVEEWLDNSFKEQDDWETEQERKDEEAADKCDVPRAVEQLAHDDVKKPMWSDATKDQIEDTEIVSFKLDALAPAEDIDPLAIRASYFEDSLNNINYNNPVCLVWPTDYDGPNTCVNNLEINKSARVVPSGSNYKKKKAQNRGKKNGSR